MKFMKRKYKKRFYGILSFILCLLVVDPISATTISDLQKDIKKNQSQLKNAQQQISDAQSAQEGIGEEIEEIDAELVSLITDINLIEEAISENGFLAKHPTTGNAIPSPYVSMSQSFSKQANNLWFQIYQVVRENCSGEYKGVTPHDDMMERLLNARRGG